MKGKLFFLLIIILLAILAFVYCFWFLPKSKEKDLCKDALNFTKNLETLNNLHIETKLEGSLSKVCDYSVVDRYYNYTYVNITNCNWNEIKNKLENLKVLSIEDIQTYSVLSIYKGIKFIGDLFYNKLLKKCDLSSSFSSILFLTFFTSSEGMVYLKNGGDINICLSDNQNLSLEEKKECLENLLKAEESMITYYSGLNLKISEENCSKKIPLGVELKLFEKNFFSTNIHEVCWLLNEYIDEVKNKTIESDENYLTKYGILSGLVQQKVLFGELEKKEINRMLIERMPSAKYRTIFENYYKDTGMI